VVTLVTGSSGLVGSAIKSLAPNDFVFMNRKDADLRDREETLSLFSNIKPKRVIHLAALVGGIGGNMMRSAEYFEDNLKINMNVFEAARINGVKSLVSLMSTCVFPDKAIYPLTVNQIHLGPPHSSNFGYAYAKRMLEVQSSAYRAQWNLNYTIGIPTNVYGPHDNFDLVEGHVIPALIHKIFRAKKENSILEVWGSGAPLREFVFAEDIAKLVIWMIEEYTDSSPLILSNSLELSIRDLVQMVANKMEYYGEIRFDSSKPDGQLRKPSDSSHLQNLLPKFEFTPLDVGIDKTTKWFLQNYPLVRGVA
jgi:GDP-L-fucose synthase